MNAKADTLLTEAKAEVEKGDGHYLTAAKKIVAAQKADTTLSNQQIADRVAPGKGEKWVRDLVRSYTSSSPETNGGKLKVDWARGSHATTAEVEEGARKALADPKQRKTLIEKLAPEDRAEIAKDVIESASDDERHEVTKAIYAKDDEVAEQARKDRRARATEHGSKSSLVAVEYELLKRSLLKVDGDLKDLLRQLDGVDWPEKTQAAALERVGKTSELVGLLRLTIEGETEFDLDEAASSLLGGTHE
jgi:hypothetical protein